MGFDEDLESNEFNYLKFKYKKLLRLFRSPKYKPFILGFILISILIVFKLTFHNLEHSHSVVTITEESYEPFLVKMEPKKKPVKYGQFVLKNTQINRKMQELNILDAEKTIQNYLKATENICIHISYFGVPLDIIVFKNFTLINSEIIEESQDFKNVKVQSIDQTMKWKKFATKIYVKYMDLNSFSDNYRKLENDESFCFLNYFT